jgi:hypothetical protein
MVETTPAYVDMQLVKEFKQLVFTSQEQPAHNIKANQ